MKATLISTTAVADGPKAKGKAGGKARAKEALKRRLVEHNSETAHPQVKEAINNLVQLAAEERGAESSWSPAQDMDVNRGNWRSITTPPFPGKLPVDDDGKAKFTLGRMSFGMFKPTKIVCAVEYIVNIIEPINDATEELVEKESKNGETPSWTQNYNMEASIEIETPSGELLPARLMNYGVCFPQSSTRLGVKFSKGTLQPRFDSSSSENVKHVALWKETFDEAIAKEADAQSYLGQIGTWTMHKLMDAMMGLEPPADRSDYTQMYVMRRPYAGYSDILYLDGDFRVMRGNRGTVVVLER